jgi:hypothetical protein
MDSLYGTIKYRAKIGGAVYTVDGIRYIRDAVGQPVYIEGDATKTPVGYVILDLKKKGPSKWVLKALD